VAVRRMLPECPSHPGAAGALVGLSEAPSGAAVHVDGAFRGAIHGRPRSSLSDSYNAVPGPGLADDTSSFAAVASRGSRAPAIPKPRNEGRPKACC
jgi:hypothetical protein